MKNRRASREQAVTCSLTQNSGLIVRMRAMACGELLPAAAERIDREDEELSAVDAELGREDVDDGPDDVAAKRLLAEDLDTLALLLGGDDRLCEVGRLEADSAGRYR